MKVALVHNAKAGKSDLPLNELERMLARGGYEPATLASTKELHRAPELDGAAFVVVAGGDGTVRKAALDLAGRRLPIAPLPIGTANNIAKSLGVLGRPEEVIAGWSRHEIHKIDVGVAKGPWGERRFLEGVGIGLVGRSIAIIERIDKVSTHEFKDPEDKLQRDLSVFTALAYELPPVRIELLIDGKGDTDDFLLLEVLNIRHAGPRIELAADADPGDGFLDLVTVTDAHRDKLKESLESCLSTSKWGPVLDAVKTRALRLRMRPGELRIDDEVVLQTHDFEEKREPDGCVTAEITVLPGALDVLVPAGRE